MFARPQSGEQVVLVYLDFNNGSFLPQLTEFTVLADSAGAQSVALITGKRKAPEANYFVSKGKLEEIQQAVADFAANLVVFNHNLTPAQERNLELKLKCRVLDRTGLILDIFAQRAQTFEGKLQVELAQLQHMSTRLVRGWTHLERQKGGIGLRGPGEKQLETDRRLLRARIGFIKQRLEKIRNQRVQSSAARKNAAAPVVALVGYTNAGKSTLFNAITQASVYAQDQLFATLDPTMRQVPVPGIGAVIFVDTVGFIQDLPHDLINAFQATLEETRSADLLLHIIDASDSQRYEKIEQVQAVLKEIGAESVPQVEVYNKVDLLEQLSPHVDESEAEQPVKIWLSAVKGRGIEQLAQGLKKQWGGEIIALTLRLPPQFAQFRAALYQKGAIVQEVVEEQGAWLIEISLLKRELESLCRQMAVNWQSFVA